jgi:hypothetical protein
MRLFALPLAVAKRNCCQRTMMPIDDSLDFARAQPLHPHSEKASLRAISAFPYMPTIVQSVATHSYVLS